jgi:hypothetical protein
VHGCQRWKRESGGIVERVHSKLYNRHFIQVNKWQFDAQFEGATILEDQHFTYSGKFLKKAKIVTPVGKDRKNPDIPEQMEDDKAFSKRYV